MTTTISISTADYGAHLPDDDLPEEGSTLSNHGSVDFTIAGTIDGCDTGVRAGSAGSGSGGVLHVTSTGAIYAAVDGISLHGSGGSIVNDGEISASNAGIDADTQGGETLRFFKPLCGHDTISDFEPGVDDISLGAYGGLDNWADVKVHIHQMGKDVMIGLSGGDEITLRDAAMADMHAADFLL